MAVLPVAWRGVFGHLLALSMAGLLTYLGIRRGGRPYSIGVWNAPFRYDRGDGPKLARLRRRKGAVDPLDLLNPWKFPVLRSRFLGVPAFFFRPRVFRFLMRLTGIASILLSWAGLPRMLLRRDRGRIDPDRPLERSARECTFCGACQPVCPAWMVTRDERVTARSKLQLGARLQRGEAVEPEEARMAFVCLHCGECTRGCQAILPLVPVWDELEEGLAARHGFPRETVDGFLADLATNEPFQARLLDHAPTLYESIDGTRRRIDLPLADTPNDSAPVASEVCDGS